MEIKPKRSMRTFLSLMMATLMAIGLVAQSVQVFAEEAVGGGYALNDL